MLRLKRILVPRDFSSCSEQALRAAFDLARRVDAEVHLLFVEVLYADAYAPTAMLADATKEMIKDRLVEGVAEEVAEGIRVEHAVLRDVAAAPAIVAYAEEHEVDLIVMGTHGRRGLRRLLLGSAAEEVVRTSQCPVLTVRGREPSAAEPRERSILVPLDFSKHGHLALAHAKELAVAYDARLDLLHVVEDYLHPAFYNTGVMTIYDIDPEIDKKSLEELKKVYGEVGGADVKADFHVRDGQAARQIVAFAQEMASMLIVMPTHGLRGLEHFLLGSVAEKVVRRASCPVFTVKSFGKSFGKNVLNESLQVAVDEQSNVTP